MNHVCFAAGLVVVGLALSADARPDRIWVSSGLCGHEACLESRLLARPVLRGRDPSGRLDPDTGRDLLNYPPDRVVDYDHMRLDLFIPDMNTPEARGEQTLRFTPIGGPLCSLTLDAVALDIDRVRLVPDGPAHAPDRVGDRSSQREGRSLEFSHDGLRLTVQFEPPLPAGVPATIATTYTIHDPRGGLIWTPETPDWPGRPAQIHTQGEPQTSSLWFPCHDFPNEKLTTQVAITVPEGFLASSNGRLLSRTPTERDGKSYVTFDWLQDTPHVNYLVTLVVGKFDVVDVGSGGRAEVPMPVYVPPGRGADVEATYGKTAEMLRFFEQRLDEPYPWDQYAQLVVWNFAWGGMENTSATTMHDTAIIAPDALIDHDLEGLISHELAHQWFGDLVTCNSWEHIWLNEGFATYLTALWFEHSRGGDDYQASIRGNFDAVISAATGRAPETPAMVSKVWSAPWETFRRQNNPYPHGASVLHMLRRRLGDEAFFAGVALYLDRTRHTSAETRDFRRAMEEATGESLERFFWQWCERPGVPRLWVGAEWNDTDGFLDIAVNQTQHIDGFNPAYQLDIPVWLAMPESGEFRWTRVHVSTDEREALVRLHMEREPIAVVVDPEMHALAELEVDQDESAWIVQLQHGPTLSARVLAARALGAEQAVSDRGPSDSRSEPRADLDALTVVARDAAAHPTLRAECLRALGRLGAMNPGRLDPRDASLPPPVRVAALDAIGETAGHPEPHDLPDPDEAAGLAAELVGPGHPATLRAGAIRVLGRLARPGAFEAIAGALDVESQDDRVRQAALDALADLDDPRGLTLVLERAHPRTNSRTRATAIGAGVRLARHNPDLAFDTLAPLLRDRQRRTFLAAGQALTDLRDPRGLEVLRSLRAEVIDPDSAWSLDSWIDALESNLIPAEATR